MGDYSSKELLIIIWITIFWAIVNATSQLQISRNNKVIFTFLDFVILFIIASFSGLMFWLVSSLFSQSIIWISLFSGIGAFLGIVWLNKIANILLKTITSQLSNSLPNTDNKNEKGTL